MPLTYSKNSLTLPSLTKDNYYFVGWFTEDGDKVESIPFGTSKVYASFVNSLTVKSGDCTAYKGEFSDFASAFTFAKEIVNETLNNATINLTSKVTFNHATSFEVPTGKTITLKRASGNSDYLLYNSDSSQGVIINSDTGGQLILDGGKIEGLSGKSLIYANTDFTMYNTTLQNNQSSENGGGFYNANDGANSKIYDCTFDNCHTATKGGAAYFQADVTLSNTTIQNCHAGTNGGGIYCYPANNSRTISIINNSSITNCTVGTDNTVQQIYFDTNNSFHCKLKTSSDGIATQHEGAVTLP